MRTHKHLHSQNDVFNTFRCISMFFEKIFFKFNIQDNYELTTSSQSFSSFGVNENFPKSATQNARKNSKSKTILQTFEFALYKDFQKILCNSKLRKSSEMILQILLIFKTLIKYLSFLEIKLLNLFKNKNINVDLSI